MTNKDGRRIWFRACAAGRGHWMSVDKPGMSLRDYFAAKAMQAFAMWSAQNGNTHHPQDQQSYSQDAYLWADAMLAERERDDE